MTGTEPSAESPEPSSSPSPAPDDPSSQTAAPVAESPDDAIGPNLFADNRRRRIPGVGYCIIGCGAVVLWVTRAGHDPVMLNAGVGIAGVLLIIFGVYSIIAGTGLDVDEEAALRHAAVAVQRPMGHAAAQMGWRGWLSRPTWRILWYSAEEPARHRGLVLVDGRDGQVLDAVTETNPEVDAPIDWALRDETD